MNKKFDEKIDKNFASPMGNIVERKDNFTLNSNINTTNNSKKSKVLKQKKNQKHLIQKENKMLYTEFFVKIKIKFFNFLLNLINAKIKSVYGYQKYLVRKFNREIVTNISIGFNLLLFNLKIKNLLNLKKFSDKYTTVNTDANKKILEKLENNENFDKILNYSVKEVYKIFLSENYKKIIFNEFDIDKYNITFDNMKRIIEKLRFEENEDDEYLKELEKYFHNIYLWMIVKSENKE